MFVDAIKIFVTNRTEALGALYKNPAPFLLATSDFRLYELLKNYSRFLRITDANTPASCRDLACVSNRVGIMAAHSVHRSLAPFLRDSALFDRLGGGG